MSVRSHADPVEHEYPTVPVGIPGPAARTASWRMRVVAGAVLTAVMLLRPSAPLFVYDAAVYWAGTKAILDGGDVFEQGRLGLRGALTSILYLPAAAVTKVAGESWAGPAVLVENAVLIAVIGVVLVPQLVGVWRPVTPLVVVSSAVGTGMLAAGFAPFPLTDLWAAALLLTAVVALGHHSPAWLAGGGLAAAVNVRPALLLPVAAGGVVVVVARRWPALWCALGVAVALAPQPPAQPVTGHDLGAVTGDDRGAHPAPGLLRGLRRPLRHGRGRCSR